MTKRWNRLFSGHAPHIEIQMHMVDGYQLIALEGQLVYENLKFVKAKLEKFNQRSKGVIVDKTKLQFIDIAGIGFLLSLAKQVKMHSEGLAIVLQNNKELMNLLMLPKVHQYIHIVPNQREAIQLLAAGDTLHAIEHYERANCRSEEK